VGPGWQRQRAGRRHAATAAWPSWAGLGREEGRASGPREKRKATWAGSEEGMERKEEILFFLFIFRVFQKYFSNGFEFLFSNLVKPIIPRMNLQQHVCIKRLLTL
jgi:hypothetical protein